MFRQTLFIVFAAVFVTSCATTPPEPELTSDIVVIDEAQRADYWVTRQDGVYVKVNSRRPMPSGCGHVVLQYVIDSRGDVFNATVLESEPPGGFDRAALAQLTEWEYVPAESNPGRTPVQVTETVEFKTRDDC